MRWLVYLAVTALFGLLAILAVPIAYPNDPNPTFPLFCVGAWIGANLVLIVELPRKLCRSGT